MITETKITVRYAETDQMGIAHHSNYAVWFEQSRTEMIAKAGFTQRNITIAALSLSIGIGFTATSEIDLWRIFPDVVQSVFSANVVAVVFVVSIILSLILPKDLEIKVN